MLEKNCLNKDTLNLFLKREVSGSQRVELETHLAGCANCRQILSAKFTESSNESEVFKAPQNLIVKVKKIPETDNQFINPPEVSVPWYKQPFLQVAFASTLILFVGVFGIYYWQMEQNINLDDTFRDGSKSQTELELISPETNASIKSKTIDFKWKKVAEVNSYTLIISDKNGDIIWEKQTKENNFTFQTMDSSKPFIDEQYYFWYVRAQSIDGKILKTPPRKFTFEK